MRRRGLYGAALCALLALSLVLVGRGSGGVTMPADVGKLAGNYTLEIQPSATCGEFAHRVWRWPVVVSSGVEAAGRKATIALQGTVKALDFHLDYSGAGAARGTLIDRDLWLVSFLSATGQIVAGDSRGEITNGHLLEGDLALADNSNLHEETVCRAADHRFSLRTR